MHCKIKPKIRVGRRTFLRRQYRHSLLVRERGAGQHHDSRDSLIEGMVVERTVVGAQRYPLTLMSVVYQLTNV